MAKNILYIPATNQSLYGVYVKKLVSLNPKRFEKVSLFTAIHYYANYRVHCAESTIGINKLYKDFDTWRTTEI